MESEIVQAFRLEAAHSLPNVPDTHKCKRVHGHSYRIDVHVKGDVDEHTGWVVDFYDIEAAFEPIHHMLDHRLLNNVEGLENPTAERIAAWVFTRLRGELAGLCQVVVHETEGSRAICRG